MKGETNMSGTRTDPHRPGAIIPTDYEYLFSYERPAMQYGYPGYFGPWGIGFVAGLRAFNEKAANWFSRRPGHCDVCGARFGHGDVWLHRPTSVHINVGHNCAEKYEMLADRAEWEAWHRAEKDRRAVAIKERKHAAERDQRRIDHAEILARLEALAAHPNASEFARSFATHTATSLVDKGWPLSEKQLALVAKLEAEATAPPKPPEVHVPAPEGRVTFTGTVVSIKDHESDWGSCYKATVKVETPDGSWLVWLTLPSGLGAQDRGAIIKVTATLTPGREAFFAFGKRPVLKEIVQEAAK